MLVQQMVVDEEIIEEKKDSLQRYTPTQKLSKSDVHFPLTTPRKRAPSITSISDVVDSEGHTVGRLTIRAREQSPLPEHPTRVALGDNMEEINDDAALQNPLNVADLPPEVVGKVFDHIFGEVHAVNSTTLRGTNVSHSMRHPRRKAVSDLALVNKDWRDLVQARIYRHIKIKGTRAGLAEAEEYFMENDHLAEHVRHIEFWVPVWGDKAPIVDVENSAQRFNPNAQTYGDENFFATNDPLGLNFKLSVCSATLAEIFQFIFLHFQQACIFTLEGGHCKKSNMIKQFPHSPFAQHLNRRLQPLPQIRTFAMRGAWNMMREYSHWQTIEQALPNVEEWHCGYAKPRQEAYTTINEILLRMPMQLRHVNISLDGMYSKDDTTLGSNSLLSGMHLCEQLGRVAPHLESLSYTGKICECFWTAAIEEARRIPEVRLTSLELVVKSCCRQRVTNYHQETGETITEEIGGIMADGAGITNLIFIKAFERLVLGSVDALSTFLALNQIRIRFIDLDSPCALLNPYWQLLGSLVYGVWNEEIVERLTDTRPGTTYIELKDGLGTDTSDTAVKKEDDSFDWRTPSSVTGISSAAQVAVGGAASTLYPKRKPRSIKTSSYRVIAETRGS